jgi:hypothetical protein
MSGEKFSLSWNEFGSNVANTFKNLLSDTKFTDVTLVSADSKQIKAHKVVLSSCSSFFSQILQENPHQHPLLFLKGISHSDLLAIVKFIYLGQTEVAQDDLDHFMEAAQVLQIQGLHENKTSVPNYSELNLNRTSMEIFNSYGNGLSPVNDDGQFQVSLLDHEKEDQALLPQFYGEEMMPNANQKVDITMKDEAKYPCDKCEYRSKYLHNLKTHKNSKHEGIRLECDQCEGQFSTKTNLLTHKHSKHEGRKYSCGECNFVSTYPSNFSQHKAKVHKYL